MTAEKFWTLVRAKLGRNKTLEAVAMMADRQEALEKRVEALEKERTQDRAGYPGYP